jgi:hypothetical protein
MPADDTPLPPGPFSRAQARRVWRFTVTSLSKTTRVHIFGWSFVTAAEC